jgi:hypothetical protein
MILQLNPFISVFARRHGYGEALFIIDYGHSVNSVWVVRFEGGEVKHFYSDDILVTGNPMDGNGWDLNIPEDWKPKKKKGRWPHGAKRNMDFLKNKE